MKQYAYIIIGVLIGFLHFVPGVGVYAPLIALLLGIGLNLSGIIDVPSTVGASRKKVLNYAIIFMGFSLNFTDVITIGKDGILLSFISLVVVISFGYLLQKLYKYDMKTAELTTFGTAICGGSAISATSAIIKPKDYQFAIAISTVFILNSVALVLFPIIGHSLDMSQEQFGIFSALAIHDVSSVVGAASIYGDQALEIATVLKLTRTLWIIPIIFALGYKYKEDDANFFKAFPIFIIAFLAASLVSTIFNSEAIESLSLIGKYLLVVALYLVGLGIKIEDIKRLGAKGVLFAITLWIVSIITALILAFNFTI